MLGCCFCTKASCYQDKDRVEYFVGGGGSRVGDFSAGVQKINGSDDGQNF